MKRQWGRTTLSPEEGKVWACHKDYARNQYSSGPKKGLKCPGKKRKIRVLRTPKLLTPEPGPLNLNKLHTFDFFSLTNFCFLPNLVVFSCSLGVDIRASNFSRATFELHKVKQKGRLSYRIYTMKNIAPTFIFDYLLFLYFI